MTIGQAHEIFEEARAFARDSIHCEAFAGYTEDEIARGTAAVLIVLRESKHAREERRPKMSLGELFILSRTLGLFGEDESRTIEVYEIVADIINSKRKGKAPC